MLYTDEFYIGKQVKIFAHSPCTDITVISTVVFH